MFSSLLRVLLLSWTIQTFGGIVVGGSSGGLDGNIPLPEDLACNANDAGGHVQHRICNRDRVLGDSMIAVILDAIADYEKSKFYCHGVPVDLQLAVFVEDFMPDYPTSMQPSTAAATRATYIHDEWGVGKKTPCGDTGMLLYLAIGDRQSYFSPGSAMEDVFSDQVLASVLEMMKPNLRSENYGSAVLSAVDDLTDYIMGATPVQSPTPYPTSRPRPTPYPTYRLRPQPRPASMPVAPRPAPYRPPVSRPTSPKRQQRDEVYISTQIAVLPVLVFTGFFCYIFIMMHSVNRRHSDMVTDMIVAALRLL